MPQRAGKVALAALIPVGAWALHGFASSNGLIQMFEDLGKHDVLSDGSTRFTSTLVGVEGFGGLLRTLLNFFWPVVNGHDTALSLYSFMFAGQGVALMTMNMLEGVRRGNKSLLVSFVTIYGVSYMVVGLAVLAPLYLLLHLATSPTASTPTRDNIAVGKASARAIVFGTTVGYILPTVFMCLPHPLIISTETKALAVVMWQAVPLWAAVFAFIWTGLHWAFASSRLAKQGSTHHPNYLRPTYFFAVAIAAITHIATLSISIISYISPDILSSSLNGTLEPLSLLAPQYPFTLNVKISSFLQGATWFLQWDYTMTSLAYMTWALAIRHSSKVKSSLPTMVGCFTAVLDVVTRVIVLGPLGTALSLVWERDESVWEHDQTKSVSTKNSRK